jgi:hypothetical protein
MRRSIRALLVIAAAAFATACADITSPEEPCSVVGGSNTCAQ